MAPPDTGGVVIVFDGVCVVCSKIVRLSLKHDRQRRIRFATMQSDAGSHLMAQFGIDPANPSSFVLLRDDQAFFKSDAALELFRVLGRAWQLLLLVKIIPRPARDFFYDMLARNRYRWFGRLNQCVIPEPSESDRFIG